MPLGVMQIVYRSCLSGDFPILRVEAGGGGLQDLGIARLTDLLPRPASS
jgi:hypothetical protein